MPQNNNDDRPDAANEGFGWAAHSTILLSKNERDTNCNESGIVEAATRPPNRTNL